MCVTSAKAHPQAELSRERVEEARHRLLDRGEVLVPAVVADDPLVMGWVEPDLEPITFARECADGVPLQDELHAGKAAGQLSQNRFNRRRHSGASYRCEAPLAAAGGGWRPIEGR